jgi:hypothetical protein
MARAAAVVEEAPSLVPAILLPHITAPQAANMAVVVAAELEIFS